MIQRPRRLRRTPAIRELCAETDLTPRHLVQPLFVVEGKGVVLDASGRPIAMPGDRVVLQPNVDAGRPSCKSLIAS